MMRFENPLVLVADVSAATDFYTNTLQLSVRERHDDFVLFDHGFAIHHGPSLLESAGIDGPATNQPWGRNNVVLYFQTAEPGALFEEIRGRCAIVHPPRKERWGETLFRIRDVDGHLIEIGDGERL
ncbi:MAG: VOC family protein [Actinomycetota bacterium]